jgi:hypothetical protein
MRWLAIVGVWFFLAVVAEIFAWSEIFKDLAKRRRSQNSGIRE